MMLSGHIPCSLFVFFVFDFDSGLISREADSGRSTTKIIAIILRVILMIPVGGTNFGTKLKKNHNFVFS